MKKSILLSVVLLSLFSISLFAQANKVISQDTIKNAATRETSNINQDTSSNKILINKYSFNALDQYGLPPTIVIDGKVSDHGSSGLEPKDIQSIRVLKGENEASLYGVKNGAGVIIVTTKKRANEIKEEKESIKK
jgi:TonB-dependent SusC/RagA subfamily outer membrane receptor